MAVFQEPRMTARRRAWQRTQELLTLGHWPARLARLAGGQRGVRVVAEQFSVPHERPSPALKIAFASDFHAGPCTHPRVLDSACRALAGLEAPVLLLGGDFVCVSARDIRELAPRLAEIPAPAGKFAVLGNHDYWAGASAVATALEAAGIQVLVNENVRLAAPFDDVWVCGLDDPISGHPRPDRTLLGADGRRIVLMHAPSGLRELADERFDLALCGHTHGGQVALPGPRPVWVPESPQFRRFAAGRFKLDMGRRLYVSRGVGYSTAPIRSFCPSEVVAVELRFLAQRPARTGQPLRIAARVRAPASEILPDRAGAA